MKKTSTLFHLFCLSLVLVASCASLKNSYRLPVQHPEEVTRNQMCTECHQTESETIVYERYNHTLYFAGDKGHSQVAKRDAQVCSMCHKQSFCNDCHATYIELTPSIKNQTANYRRMPHRGDYLARHQIDGRIDPISCFKCHGNTKSSKTCAGCHG